VSGTTIVQLRNRLGNQFFQYAYGRALAQRHGGEVAFLPAAQPGRHARISQVVQAGYREPTRGELIRVLRVGGQYRNGRNTSDLVLDTAVRRAGSLMSKSLGWPHHVTEKVRAFDPELLSVRGSALVEGFFQSESYFIEVKDELDAAIQLPNVDHILGDLPRPIVSVAFRRGDYSEYNLLLPLDYYDRALSLLRNHVEPATIVVSADDPDFAVLISDRLAHYAKVVVCMPRHTSHLHDLAVMASADHNVISNSTFAWWGAWLGERRIHPECHVVVAPQPWLRGIPDIVPSRWLTVEVGASDAGDGAPRVAEGATP
jgi:hypothetical protein